MCRSNNRLCDGEKGSFYTRLSPMGQYNNPQQVLLKGRRVASNAHPGHEQPLSTNQFYSRYARFTPCAGRYGAEVAFAGRSNAGKSSALNVITGQRALARISKAPGRTREINFFQVRDDLRLVDLPGYGYAKVSKAMKGQWQRNIAYYLETRQSLCGAEHFLR